MEFAIIWLLIGALISALTGFLIGEIGDKNNGGVGFVLGGLLGPIGWIIVAVLPANGESPKKEKAEDLVAKVARMEAELAALKKVPSQKSDEDDIPTYKLD